MSWGKNSTQDGGGFLEKIKDSTFSFFGSLREKLSGSSFEWFNFDTATQGFGDIVMLIVNIIFTIIALTLLLVVVFLLAKYPMRFIYEKMRMKYLGGMVWNEVIHEGAISDGETFNAVGQMDNAKNIMPNISSGINFGITFDRPRYTVAIRLNPEDEQTHMYIGMSRRHYDPNVLTSWAAGANCSVEEVDFDDIGFIAKAPVTLVREDYNTGSFTDQPTNSKVGGVITRLQGNTAMTTGATVVISYENMRKHERSLLKSHINSKNEKEGGEAAKLDQTARNVNVFLSGSPVRSTITAFSDNGDSNVSHSVMETVRGNMPSLGVMASSNEYERLNRKAGVIALFVSLPLMILGWLSFIPLWIPFAAVGLALSSIIGLSFLSSMWINMAARKDMTVPIPPFIRWSPRRMWDQITVDGIFDLDTGALRGRYIGEPSSREVIPMYQTSMMQFASMPLKGRAHNISSMAVPQVAMPSAVNQDISGDIANDHVALLGTSVRSFQPTMLTADDLNFGVAMAGNPGSGKTNELSNLFAGISHLSRQNNGYTFTPIWLETKSDDVTKLQRKINTYNPLVFSVHTQDQPRRLCLEGGRVDDENVDISSIEKNVSINITAMERLWGNGSFGPRSKQVATAALTIAMLLTKKERDGLGLSNRVENPDRPNVMSLVRLLIGSDPSLTLVNTDKRNKVIIKGKEFADGILELMARRYRGIIQNRDELMKMAAKRGDREVQRIKALTPAMDQLISLYETPDAVKPLQNKIPVLEKSLGLWETVDHSGNIREEFSIREFIDYKGPVLVDLTPRGSSLSVDEARDFTMLIHYMLWEELRNYGAGWAAQKRYTPIFVDELSNITGERNGESTLGGIIAEVRDQGRSSGVSHNVGFQRYNQLPPEAESTVKNFTSKLYFQMESSDDRTIIMDQLGDLTRFSTDSIKSLPIGYAIADLRIGGKKRGVFTLKTPLFSDYVQALTQTENVSDAFDVIVHMEKESMNEDKKKRADDVDTTTNVDIDDAGNTMEDPGMDAMVDDDNDASMLSWD